MSIYFLLFCLGTSLCITAIHVACWKGNVLFKARNTVGKFLYHSDLMWLEKPLYDCLPCMASFWGMLFWIADGMHHQPILVVLCVSGINCLIETVVHETAD